MGLDKRVMSCVHRDTLAQSPLCSACSSFPLPSRHGAAPFYSPWLASSRMSCGRNHVTGSRFTQASALKRRSFPFPPRLRGSMAQFSFLVKSIPLSGRATVCSPITSVLAALGFWQLGAKPLVSHSFSGAISRSVLNGDESGFFIRRHRPLLEMLLGVSLLIKPT